MRVSVVVPARNEAGTIEEVVKRVSDLGSGTEIVFVEGDPQDGTWNEIQRVREGYADRNIKVLRQPGSGKGDAVRAGSEVATGDIFIILDADLTVAPEELPKFYEAIATGRCEFAMGCAFSIPSEKRCAF
jgi:glycosyltransferase involved in cell wall biosynthesis